MSVVTGDASLKALPQTEHATLTTQVARQDASNPTSIPTPTSPQMRALPTDANTSARAQRSSVPVRPARGYYAELAPASVRVPPVCFMKPHCSAVTTTRVHGQGVQGQYVEVVPDSANVTFTEIGTGLGALQLQEWPQGHSPAALVRMVDRVHDLEFSTSGPPAASGDRM